jgi:type 1 glutamine amidotransferase/HEAT repeat protein
LRSESLLRCAEAFETKGDTSAAGALYDALNSSRQPSHIRAAALSGMIRCRGDRANAVLLGALTNGDDVMAAALVQALRQPGGRTLATLVAGRTSKLSSRRRSQVFYAIADAGERGALKDMYAALGSRQPLLRRAALYGIAKLGDASSVARLCDAMKNADPAQREEIGKCLSRLQGQAVDERLCSVVGSQYPLAVKEQVIAALAVRGASSAVPALLAAATTGSGTLREAAVNALGSLADGSISRDVIRMLKNERSATSRSALVRCLVDLALRDRTPERVCTTLLASLPGSSAVARASMFQVLGRFGGAKEFQAVRPALTDADPVVQRSAIRVLSAWTDSAPLEDLFALAHSPADPTVRTLAMEGAVSLLEKSHDLQEDAMVRILERELGRAESREIETMLISTLGKLSTPGALQLAESRLGRSEVATEAALAVAGIAGTMGEKDAEVAQRALMNALRSVRSSPVEARIRAALDDRQFQTGQRKIRVALITGGHPFDEQAFLGMFSSDTGITCTHVPQKDDSELFEETAGWPYDVVVLYNMTRTISEKRQQNLLRLLDAGVGLLSLHHASAAFSDWCEYPKIIGCRYLLAPVEHDGMRLEPSTYRHDVDIPVHVADSGHAVTAGVHDFVVRDETYHGCQFEPDNHLLLTTDEQSSDAPLAWARQYRQARVVHCQLGHGPGIFADGQFRTLVAQAIKWCAGGRREQIVREADLRRSQQ